MIVGMMDAYFIYHTIINRLSDIFFTLLIFNNIIR